MLKFISFGSGSCGNCYYLSNGKEAILIDAGVGIRRVKRHLKDFGIVSNTIKGILITHDHADHIKGAGYISNELNIPVYTTQNVHNGISRNYHAFKKIDPKNIVAIEQDKPFMIGDFSITAFYIPHDATENNGYCIQCEGETFTIMTDVGAPTDNVKKYIDMSNHLVIEANYDVEMLKTGKYPQILKERIASGNGHMSNTQTAQVLAEHLHPNLHNVWLCHLSEENNHPELARKTIECHLRSFGIIAGKDFMLEVLRRKIPTGPFEL